MCFPPLLLLLAKKLALFHGIILMLKSTFAMNTSMYFNKSLSLISFLKKNITQT